MNLVASAQPETKFELGQASTVLLSTLVVLVKDRYGNFSPLRAVLDSGAQVSFITSRAVHSLGLSLDKVTNSVVGLSLSGVYPKGKISCSLKSLYEDNLFTLDALVLPRITSDLPCAKIHPSVRELIGSLPLADEGFDRPSAIDLLLSADVYANSLRSGRLYLGPHQPALFESKFGWLLLGSAPILPSDSTSVANIVVLHAAQQPPSLESLVRSFWITEEPPSRTRLALQDDPCEEHFSTTHTRTPSGKFMVRLPFKRQFSPDSSSRLRASRSFRSLETRFSKDPFFKQRYVDFIRNFQVSGYMTPIEEESQIPRVHYFIPHHGIFKSGSIEPKLRVVFNASAQTDMGLSLNEVLYSGPPLQNDLVEVLLRFRFHKIAFTCDIKQMFLRIEVHPDDRFFQLILWREDVQLPLKAYTLNTVTFGVTCSPFLAIRCLKELAASEANRYPQASRALVSDTFVDDVVTGSASIQEAIDLQSQLISMLSSAGLELRKWASNSPPLLAQVPQNHHSSPVCFSDPMIASLSILGLQWSPDKDIFCYVVHPIKAPSTKRGILSTVAKLYDPLGLVAPVLVWAKTVIQHLWVLGLDWDEPPPQDLTLKWELFASELPLLKQVQVPRWFLPSPYVEVQLHGFSDASQTAYAAVCYLRVLDTLDHTHVNLVLAKTRVAPLRTLSIPRLELNASHLLAKIIFYVSSILSANQVPHRVFAWTDSSVVLAWIKSSPYQLKTFVANRVSQIQDWIPPSRWRHVPTSMNPADPASRGQYPSQLLTCELWWRGPSFLTLAPSQWPITTVDPLDGSKDPEVKPTPLNLLVAPLHASDFNLLTRFSSWSRLLNVTTYLLRFAHNLKGEEKLIGVLTPEEIRISENSIVKLLQAEAFESEISRLKRQMPMGKSFRRLAAFLDDEGLLRAGGRLHLSDLPLEQKHPLLLPKQHHVVNLIVDHLHVQNLHAGPQLLQSLLVQRYWIFSARSVIRSRVFKCNRCFRSRPFNKPPLMGNLPSFRVRPSRPFSRVGVDYAGPFTLKLSKTRKPITTHKAYLCLFICMATRAVHLEVATDLTAEAFIAALIRFVARRGYPSDLHSDCGTNFVGGATILHRMITNFIRSHQEAISSFSTSRGIKFHFLPPAAPFQGGLWEAAVKSAKFHLKRVIGTQLLLLEEFMTLSSQVEAILNSRPISPASADPSELRPLTPGHFLIGGPLVAIPEPDYTTLRPSALSRWKLTQSLYQSLWAAWRRDYLHTLLPRGKWTSDTPGLQVGDLVIMEEPNCPPLMWHMGRIVFLNKGADGVARSAQVQTSRGEFRRPVLKLYPLPNPT